MLVTLQFVASDFVLRHLIYRQAIGSLPVNGSGGGSCTHGGKAYEAHLNLILPAVKIGGVWRVTLPLVTACKAGASLFSHGPTKLASRPGAAPGELSFGDSAARAGARLVEIKRAGSVHAPGPCHFNKEQTPPGDLFDPSPRIHGGCFGV